MVQFNFSERTIKAKVVYYGPPQSGKTTNLEQIHRLTDPGGANRLISLNTAQDRTLFFDLLPFSLGAVSGYDFKIQLYTVPGQVQYNATRRVVLAGADAVVFVADSQKSMARDNATAFENMKVNLLANRLVPEKVPLVLQYNKQDLENLLGRGELDASLNFWGRKAFPATACRGEGVLETFVAIVQEMLSAIAIKYNLKEKGLDPEAIPDVVANAFRQLVSRARPAGAAPPTGGGGTAASGPVPREPTPPRVVIAQPEGIEPAYAGSGAGESGPVSEELLHRAIRSNVDLAEVVGELTREFSLGLGLIRSRLEGLSPATGEKDREHVAAITGEVERLREVLQRAGAAPSGQPGAGTSGALAGSAGRAAPLRAQTGELAAPARVAAAAVPMAAAPAARVVLPPRPAVAQPAAHAAVAASGPVLRAAGVAPGAAASLDALLAEVALAHRSLLAARPVTIQSHVRRGTPLPRCSPAGLKRTLSGFVQGVTMVAASSSTITVRADRKPVLLRGRDGREVKRDFLMLAFAHTDGLGEDGQQRVLKGVQPGPLGDGHQALREVGGFLRFAPLPGGLIETRLFLPL